MEGESREEIELTENESEKSTNWFPKHIFYGKRFLVAILVWFTLLLVYGAKFNHFLSIAVHYIHPRIKSYIANESMEESEESEESEEFDMEEIQDIIFGCYALIAFYSGYCLTGIPGGYLSYRFPATRIFFCAALATSFFNVLYPSAVHSKGGLIVLHLLQGLAEGMLLPSFFGIWKNWSPTKEFNVLVPFSYSGLFLGLLSGSGITYELIHHWDIPYYIFGGLAIIWMNLWLWLIYDSPSLHPTIKQDELMLFTNLESISVGSFPWRKMFTSLPVWTIIIGSVWQNLIYTFAIHEEFINHFIISEYIGYNDTIPSDEWRSITSEWVTMDFYLPFSIPVILIPLAGLLVYCLNNHYQIPVLRLRKGFACFGFALGIIFWIVSIFVFDIQLLAAIAFIFYLVGIFPNPLEIAPQYVSIVVGISNSFGVLVGILIPTVIMISALSHIEELYIWMVSVFGALLSLIGGVLYAIYASDEKQQWAE